MSVVTLEFSHGCCSFDTLHYFVQRVGMLYDDIDHCCYADFANIILNFSNVGIVSRKMHLWMHSLCLFFIYSGTLIIGPLLGGSKTGQIGKVVTLSRWPEWMLSLTAGQYG